MAKGLYPSYTPIDCRVKKIVWNSAWSMGLYLFLVCYAVTLFHLQAVLVPRTWDGVTSLKDYFLERRAWFYSFLLFATILDFFDSYLNGGFEYVLDTGVINLTFAAATIPVFIVGLITTGIRIHNFMGTIFFGWQGLLGFGNLEILAS